MRRLVVILAAVPAASAGRIVVAAGGRRTVVACSSSSSPLRPERREEPESSPRRCEPDEPWSPSSPSARASSFWSPSSPRRCELCWSCRPKSRAPVAPSSRWRRAPSPSRCAPRPRGGVVAGAILAAAGGIGRHRRGRPHGPGPRRRVLVRVRARGRGCRSGRPLARARIVHDRGARHRSARDHRDGARLGERRAPTGAGDQLADARRDVAAPGPGGRQPGRQRQRHDRGRRGAQRRARAVDELAHRVLREPQLLGDLVLRAPLDRDPQQRVALAVRERGQSGERPPHHRPALGQLRRPAAALERLAQLVVVVAHRTAGVQRGVVDDPVQPGPQLAHVVTAPQRRPGGEERLLERVLGPRLGQVAPGVAQQRAAVPLHDRLESTLMPAGRQRDQSLVRLGPQEGDRWRGHEQPYDTRNPTRVTHKLPREAGVRPVALHRSPPVIATAMACNATGLTPA